MTGFDLSFSSKSLRVLVFYRSPSGDMTSQIDYLEKASRDLRALIVPGVESVLATDANLSRSVIDWHCLTARSPLAQAFLDLTLSLGLSQCVSSPTRGENILDLVFLSSPESLSGISVNPPFLPSDHYQVDFSLFPQGYLGQKRDVAVHQKSRHSLDSPKDPPAKKRAWKRADYQGMRDFLRDVDWNELLTLPLDCTGLLSFLSLILDDVVERFVPFAPRLTPKSGLPPRLHALRKLRFCLLKDGAVSRARFRVVDKRYRKSLKAHFDARERAMVNGGPSGVAKWFNVSRSSNVRAIPDIHMPDGSVLVSASEKALAFADRFSRDFNVDNGVPLGLPPCPLPHFGRPTITVASVESAISKLAPKLSSGPDGFPMLLLRRVGPQLAVPLAELYGRSLAGVDVPEGFLPVSTVPVPKPGKPRHSIDSWRPISLSSVLVRPLEKLLVAQILGFLLDNGRISKSQFGFLPGHSTSGQLIEYTDFVSRHLNKGNFVWAVLVDVKAAFSAAPVSKLVESFAALGIVSPLLDWIQEFLACRTSTVVVENCKSDPYDVISGGVQGSSISCLAFLCYLDPVLKGLAAFPKVHTSAYCDDVKLASEDPKALQEALDYLVHEFDRRQLSLSLPKCVVIRFNPKSSKDQPPDPSFMIHGFEVTYAKQGKATRDLGIMMDDKLTLASHADHVASRCRFVAGQILRCLRLRDATHLARAYSTFVIPLIDYGSTVYAGCPKKSIDGIERVQKWFTRRVFRVCRLPEASYERRLEQLGLSDVASRLRSNDLIFAHSVYHGKHRCETLVPEPPTHRYPVSKTMRFCLERRRSGLRKTCPANRIALRWNHLSDSLAALKKQAFTKHVRRLPE